MYSLYADIQRGLMIAELSGFLNAEDAAAYMADHDAEVTKHFPDGRYQMLFDISGCVLQSQAVLQMMTEWGARNHGRGATAIVTGVSLAKMQAKRVADARRTRLFETVDAAEAWLFSDAQQAAAA